MTTPTQTPNVLDQVVQLLEQQRLLLGSAKPDDQVRAAPLLTAIAAVRAACRELGTEAPQVAPAIAALAATTRRRAWSTDSNPAQTGTTGDDSDE